MNRYLEKIASGLKSHQQRALTKFETAKGLVVNHSTGSGKTRTFLEAVLRDQASNPDSNTVIFTPASLVSNVHKEIAKHKLPIDSNKVKVLSYDKAIRNPDQLSKTPITLVIADEAHKLRDSSTKRTQILRPIIEGSSSRLLPTATMNYNHLADMAPLINMSAGKEVLPENRKDMEARYVQKTVVKPKFLHRLIGVKPTEVTRLKDPETLRKNISPYVDYYNAYIHGSGKDYPTSSEKVVPVEMSPQQARYYKFLEGNLPLPLRIKIRANLPMDKKERASLNSFATGIRQVSNSTTPYSASGDSSPTPKIEAAVSSLEQKSKENPRFKGLVYSNFLNAGLADYSKALTDKGIAHNVYTGAINPKEKDRMVSEYNSGKVPVLLVSSSGTEGLDLKGTRLIQILEPHFNKSKIRQVVGRGKRQGSHLHLPENERHVDVEYYQSLLPKPMMGKAPTSIDQYLTQNSDNKDELFEQVSNLISDKGGNSD